MSTGPTISVREATPLDIDALVDLSAALALDTEGKTLDRERLKQGTVAVFEFPENGFYIVAEADGEIAGAIMVGFEWSDWRNANFWWVETVYVKSEWRRRGVYRSMSDWVYKTARSRSDVCGIRLYSDRKNDVAQRTFLNLGMIKSRYDLFEVDFVFGPD